MRLITFRLPGPLGSIERVGALDGTTAVDLAAAYEDLLARRDGVTRARALAEAMIPPDMTAFLGNWPLGRRAAEEALDHALGEPEDAATGDGRRFRYQDHAYTLAPPLRPTRIKDYLTYELHKLQVMKKRGIEMPDLWYRMPTYTNRNHTAIAGPDDDIAWPRYSEKLDVEFEIGLVVGKRGRDIAAADAADYVAGFTIYNDISARDTQANEATCGSGPGKSKDFDQGNVVGPVIVTADEIDGQNIELTLFINGEQWARGNTRDMKHTWGAILENASRGETIHPGDLFGSGTMDGGCCQELNRWFEPGALIEMKAEGIGTLRNRIS